MEKFRAFIDATLSMLREGAKLTETDFDDRAVAGIESVMFLFLGPRVYGADGAPAAVEVPAEAVGAWWLPIVLAAIQAFLSRKK